MLVFNSQGGQGPLTPRLDWSEFRQDLFRTQLNVFILLHLRNR